MKYKLIFISILLLCLPAKSQTSNDEQLLQLMKEFNLLLTNEMNSEALILLEEEKEKYAVDNLLAQTQLNFLYSKYYILTDNLDSGKNYALKAYNISQQTNDELTKAYGLYAMCYYYQQFDYSLSFEYAQKIIQTIQLDQYPYLAYQVYYRLYVIHSNWDEGEDANLYAQKALDSATKLNDFNGMSNAYSAKSIAMGILYSNTQKKTYQDSVLYYLKASIKLDDKYPGQIGERTNVIAHINIGNYFFQQFRNNEIPFAMARDSISKYIKRAEDIPLSLDSNYELRASALGMRSYLAQSAGDYETAEKLLLQAYNNLKEETTHPAFYTLYNVTIGLYHLYDEQEDYENAFEFLKINNAYKDSLYNKEKIREVHALEAKYENEKMQQKVDFLENKSRFQKIQNYLLIAICILVLISLYLFRKNNLKKLALQKEKSISLQKGKAEAEAQINLEKEKQARMSAERKILKLENEQMQKEAIVQNLQIKRKNELLESFRKKIASLDSAFEINKSLKQEKRIEKSLNDTVKEFEDINPNFFNYLKEYSDNKLTKLDLRYCAYFHLGLGTKEIAQIFKVEPKSIRMKKYRIKQKLNLPKNQTLENFLEQIEMT